MSKKEDCKNYTEFQLELRRTLIEMGFKFKYFSTWEKAGYQPINISKMNGLKDVILWMHKDGKQQKCWEIASVLKTT